MTTTLPKGLLSLAAIGTAMVMLLSTISQASALNSQPYIGAYGVDGTKVYHADKIFVSTRYLTQTGSPNQDVASVLSSAGSTSASGTGGETGFMYQAVSHWDTNGDIWTDNQVWGPNSAQANNNVELWGPVTDTHILRSNTDHVVGQANIGSRTSVVFTQSVTKTDFTTQVFTDTYSRVSWDSSTYMLAGKCTGSACYSGNTGSIEFFQWGVESPSATSNFKVEHKFPKIWDTYSGDVGSAQWIQFNTKHANAIYGDGNLILWWWDYSFGNPPFQHNAGVGDLFYPNLKPIVSFDTGGHPYVTWNYQVCNPTRCVSNDSPLW